MGTGEVRFIGTVVEVNEDISVIEIDQRFCPGLDQLDSYSELDVLFWFHFRDDDKQSFQPTVRQGRTPSG